MNRAAADAHKPKAKSMSISAAQTARAKPHMPNVLQQKVITAFIMSDFT